ncbi:hypothetical protein [Salinicola salarius]|jgi:hypothetical protein|uniref:hypothetical protein n=1 Tax=Salinicola salarius TaxID=430457 RepID=UPI0026EBFDC2|nr:hypothetical protein [Salinicola salarius]
MKHFTLKIGSQSLEFTEQDIPALDEALNVAVNRAGREVIRHSANGQRVSVLMSRQGDSALDTLPRDPNTVLMRDLRRGPAVETDC